ncbi:hypothetical protein O1Q96_37545 [Streptomyces sp. Qhu-G9]|uniref:hypothetical protein n=1 Tax=Streptomyces sp. Qhu-G9 TaxID=3452799 RepID=UPI0022ABD8F8|nr:hypothetical protein [Streptomyces aurantiacus]WAU84899.1 hypothetical protein O1Q96_37545 [Streptomyces aurantiacus]
MHDNSTRWTSDHLTKPGGTALYAAQQRERLRQMADQVQALLGEYQADLEAVRIDGDKPFERRLRAYFASRPLANLEKSLRAAVNAIGKLDPEFQRRFVELPAKREQKAEAKALEKARSSGASSSRSVNTAAHLQSLSQGLQEPAAGGTGLAATNSPEGAEPTFLGFLEKGA